MIRKATVRSYNAGNNTATVQIIGSLSMYLPNIPVATNISPSLMVAGARVGVLFFDDNNPADACVAFVY